MHSEYIWTDRQTDRGIDLQTLFSLRPLNIEKKINYSFYPLQGKTLYHGYVLDNLFIPYSS
jgi:hypothetical protein